MADIVCPKCGSVIPDNQPCGLCNAIATPEVAAKVAVPTTDGEGKVSIGRPPAWPPLTWAFYAFVALFAMTCLGLIIPPLLFVREASMRTQSICHLKQIGLAAHGFYDVHKRFPFNGTNQARPGDATSGSWCFQILPFMEKNDVFQAGSTNEGIKQFLCPGRGRPLTSNTPAVGADTPPWSDYVLNPWLNSDTGDVAAIDSRRTFADITDGTSNTILCGEGQIRPRDYSNAESIPGYLDTFLIGGTTATALSSNLALGPVTFARDSDDTRTDAARGFGGPYSGGCNVAFCDGTVRWLSYSLKVGSFAKGQSDLSLASLLTPAAGDEPFWEP
ncbi:MAG TPA: DUF1559 domain-containing protein [Gemmataceae bacterium]|nr:DUF1559 domain-containing protein [Gemmataceae bacterium]